MEQKTIKPYNEERALAEAENMKEKMKKGEARDYNDAEKMVDQEKTDIPETSHSIFSEKILTRGRDDLEIDEKEKGMLMRNIKLIASEVEKILRIKDNEELLWDIDFIPALSETEQNELRIRAEKDSKQKIWEFVGEESYEGEKMFGTELIDDCEKLERQDFLNKWKPRIVEYLMTTYVSKHNFMLRANIDVSRVSKGNSESGIHYTNINLFGDKIVEKWKGETTIDDIAKDIAKVLGKEKG